MLSRRYVHALDLHGPRRSFDEEVRLARQIVHGPPVPVLRAARSVTGMATHPIGPRRGRGSQITPHVRLPEVAAWAFVQRAAAASINEEVDAEQMAFWAVIADKFQEADAVNGYLIITLTPEEAAALYALTDLITPAMREARECLGPLARRV